VRILAQGEGGVVVELGDGIDPALSARVDRLAREVRVRLGPAVDEVVPAYRSLLVVHDPLRTPRPVVVAALRALADEVERAPLPEPGRIVRIPTRYGGVHGPDLADVARLAGLAEEEVVRLHAATVYPVHFLGFTPGFPYLGGLDPRLATPRLATPRARIPAGSVAIGGAQTGVYPVESPGGWRLVGRTPLRLFDPRSREPFLLAPGDRLRFVPVDEGRFEALAADVAAGRHVAEVEG
jgi:KipI family sensor histidine kinase inhibitor